MEITDVAMKLVLALMGILIYALWKVRDHLRTFSFRKFKNENKVFWGWSILFILTLLVVTTLEPTSGEAIKTMTGLDVNNERVSFLSLGWALSMLANQLPKSPIGKKSD